MADRPYRAVKKGGGWFTFLTIVAVIGGPTLAVVIEKRFQAWVFGVSLVLAVVFFILAIQMYRRSERKRITKLVEALEDDGWTWMIGPSGAQVAEFFGKFEFVITWGEIDKMGVVNWAAHRGDELLYEHMWTTNYGRSTQEHSRTGWVILTSHEHEGLYMRRPEMGWRGGMKGKLVPTGDEGFDGRWAATGPVPQDLREAMGDSPKGESWSFGTSCLACWAPIAMDAQNVRMFAARGAKIATIASSTPSEL